MDLHEQDMRNTFASCFKYLCKGSLLGCPSYPTIIFRISFANVMITPPARVRNPLALWLGSWLFKDNPICTIPKPSRISPIALIKLKIKVDKLLMTVNGSSAANAMPAPTVSSRTITI